MKTSTVLTQTVRVAVLVTLAVLLTASVAFGMAADREALKYARLIEEPTFVFEPSPSPDTLAQYSGEGYLPYTEHTTRGPGHHLLGDAPSPSDMTIVTNGSAFEVPMPSLPYTEQGVPLGYKRDGQLLVY